MSSLRVPLIEGLRCQWRAPLQGALTAASSPLLSRVALAQPAWRAEDDVADILQQRRVTTAEPEEIITLLPDGAPKRRLTSFPTHQA